MKYVKVEFEKRSQVYTYFVPEGDDPKIGDRVITSCSTETSYEQGYPVNMKMARVINVLTEDDGKATNFYTFLIAKGKMEAQKKANVEYLAKRDEKKAIKTKLEDMLKAQTDMDRFARPAETNPEAAELLAKLQEG